MNLSCCLFPAAFGSDAPIGKVKFPKKATHDPQEIKERLDAIFDGRSIVRLYLEDTGEAVKDLVAGADERGYTKVGVEGGPGASVHVYALKSELD